MVESSFQSKVLKYLEQNNIFAVKQNASGISKTGIPDILANINGVFVGIEIKRNKNSKATELQKYNINLINKRNGIAFVLRPETFDVFKIMLNIFLLDKTNTKVDTFRKNMITRIGIE